MSDQTLVSVIGGVAAILGAVVGATATGYVAYRNGRAERRSRVQRDKLQNFYGPLLATRNEIKAMSELRLEISVTASGAWPKLFDEAYRLGVAGICRVEQIEKERWPDFDRSVEYSNKQVTDRLIPAYRRMLRRFLSRYDLAEASTRAYLPELIRYVEIWERWIARSIPAEVLAELNHTEQHLHPFYSDLESHFARLQGEIAEVEHQPFLNKSVKANHRK